MAKKKTVWEDDKGRPHETEAAAIRADERYRAEKILRMHCQLIAGPEGGIDLTGLEKLNRESLQPLYDYLGRLLIESDERRNKHGGR
jgi:hypothetical protein